MSKPKTLAELLTAARTREGLSYREAQDLTGVSATRIAQLEDGDVPRQRTLRKLVAGYGLDLNEALKLAGYPPVPTGEGGGTVTWTGAAAGSARPVGLGLDDAAAGLTDDDIEDVRALIRAKRERRGLT